MNPSYRGLTKLAAIMKDTLLEGYVKKDAVEYRYKFKDLSETTVSITVIINGQNKDFWNDAVAQYLSAEDILPGTLEYQKELKEEVNMVKRELKRLFTPYLQDREVMNIYDISPLFRVKLISIRDKTQAEQTVDLETDDNYISWTVSLIAVFEILNVVELGEEISPEERASTFILEDLCNTDTVEAYNDLVRLATQLQIPNPDQLGKDQLCQAIESVLNR